MKDPARDLGMEIRDGLEDKNTLWEEFTIEWSVVYDSLPLQSIFREMKITVLFL